MRGVWGHLVDCDFPFLWFDDGGARPSTYSTYLPTYLPDLRRVPRLPGARYNLVQTPTLPSERTWKILGIDTDTDSDRVIASPLRRPGPGPGSGRWGGFLCLAGHSDRPRSIPTHCLLCCAVLQSSIPSTQSATWLSLAGKVIGRRLCSPVRPLVSRLFVRLPPPVSDLSSCPPVCVIYLTNSEPQMVVQYLSLSCVHVPGGFALWRPPSNLLTSPLHPAKPPTPPQC